MMDLFLTNTKLFHKTLLIDGLELFGLLVDYCLFGLHSDGTHSLQWIHWWAGNGMLNYSKSVKKTNSSTSWPFGEYMFSKSSCLGWTIPLILTNNKSSYLWQIQKRPSWSILQSESLAAHWSGSLSSYPSTCWCLGTGGCKMLWWSRVGHFFSF